MLDQNQLAELPESFGRLAALCTLNLNRNQLTALPESFGQLAALKYLEVNGVIYMVSVPYRRGGKREGKRVRKREGE